jgi:orotidine-5'-phosphate decarboxylase
MHNPLIVALDLPDADSAIRLATVLAPVVGALKIGSELYTTAGPDIVRRIRDLGAEVFLDLKFHDIPHTVARAVAVAVRLNVRMLTIHTSGGLEMMKAAEVAARETASAHGFPVPLVLGVTVLTSMDGIQLASVTGESRVEFQVERLARLAVDAGLRGLVCSPLELPQLRRVLSPELQLITPGIRGTNAKGGDDQKRTLGPREALEAGANWLVVGRPILSAADPVSAAREILQSCGRMP